MCKKDEDSLLFAFEVLLVWGRKMNVHVVVGKKDERPYGLAALIPVS